MIDQEDDGLGSFELEQIGMQGGAFGAAKILKFDTDHYVSQGVVIGPEREFIVLRLVKFIQKWVGGKQAAPPIIVPAGERVPNIGTMNEDAPREEWGTDFSGNPAGPYKLVLALKLLEETSLNRFVFLSQSKGGAVGIGELSDKTKIMRQFRGSDLVPVVSLGISPWPIKRLNLMKKKPDFRPLRWIKRPGSGGGQLPPPEPPPAPKWVGPPLPAPAHEPVQPPPAAEVAPKMPIVEAPSIGTPVTLGEPVSEPTLAEEMRDEVPF